MTAFDEYPRFSAAVSSAAFEQACDAYPTHKHHKHPDAPTPVNPEDALIAVIDADADEDLEGLIEAVERGTMDVSNLFEIAEQYELKARRLRELASPFLPEPFDKPLND